METEEFAPLPIPEFVSDTSNPNEPEAILIDLTAEEEIPRFRSPLKFPFDFTPREYQVALLTDRTNEEISEILCISPWTVKSHIAKILRKMGLKSRRDVLKKLVISSGEGLLDLEGHPPQTIRASVVISGEIQELLSLLAIIKEKSQPD